MSERRCAFPHCKVADELGKPFETCLLDYCPEHCRVVNENRSNRRVAPAAAVEARKKAR